MDQASRAAIVTGTVLHLDTCVVVMPTQPPAMTRLPRSGELRRMFLTANPGWTAPDPEVADRTRRENAMTGLQAGTLSVIELHGTDLPADSIRARLRGVLIGRSVHVGSWRPEPCSTSSWAEPRVEGTDVETASAISHSVPEDWPLISIGISTTTAGRSAVMLEVERLTPAVQSWFGNQPSGSVQLDTFIDFAPGPDLVGMPT